jgi:metal-dependent amidase/aminoacylase/carboxypeptidase family protein
MVDRLLAVSDQVLGAGKCQMVPPSMGGEDFSYYTEHVPGVFFRLGVGNPEKQTQYPLHHPMFDVDEDALPIGIAMLCAMALHYLGE